MLLNFFRRYRDMKRRMFDLEVALSAIAGHAGEEWVRTVATEALDKKEGG